MRPQPVLSVLPTPDSIDPVIAPELPTDLLRSLRCSLRRAKTSVLTRDHVKLTVIHDDLVPAGLTGSLISNGWPRVLANLKTLLETGETLPAVQLNTPARLGLTR